MSIMVGVGRGALKGILFRNADSLERLEKVTTLIVDKTGTLTEGRPKLTDVMPSPGYDEQKLLRLAASLEQASEHPLAASIVRGARDRSLDLEQVTNFHSVTGGGVIGIVGGHEVMVGKPDLLRNKGVAEMESLKATAAALQRQGKTVVFVAIDGRAAGVIAVADPIKSTTQEAVRELHDMGVKIVMLTGDNRRTAATVAETIGIDDFEAEMEPAGKADYTRKLKRNGEVVAMAGDGVNDAPALSAAEVGIAMGTGTDVAIQSAGITLVKGDLRGIAEAIRLSRATMRNIRQNLFFAFGYNALGIPVAAGLLYPFFGLLLSPIVAGAAMSLSSVSVIANALRLQRTALICEPQGARALAAGTSPLPTASALSLAPYRYK
jgi:Cu+-exporting ATPase